MKGLEIPCLYKFYLPSPSKAKKLASLLKKKGLTCIE